MKFLRHVPAWVVQEVEANAAMSGDVDFRTVVSSKDVAQSGLWSSMEKRKIHAVFHSIGPLSLLFHAIHHGRHGFTGDLRLPHGKRSQIAKKIDQQAARLFEQLADLDESLGVFPDLMIRYLDAAHSEALDGSDSLTWRHSLERYRPPSRAPLQRTLKHLSALSIAAKAWGNAPQILGKPGDSNASRLFFLRQVTDHFSMVYKTPLRKQTFAITSALFNCDDITVEDLSRLAPVSKRFK